MKIKNLGLVFPLVFALASCGGGGDVAGDVTSFSVLPASFTWVDSECVVVEGVPTTQRDVVESGVSIHTINGGRPPFRVRSQSEKIKLGLVGKDNKFDSSAAVFSDQGDLMLSGKDPKFALSSSLGCNDDLSVIVLDYHSKVVSVELSVDAPE